MDGWMNGWLDGWMVGWVGVGLVGQNDELIMTIALFTTRSY